MSTWLPIKWACFSTVAAIAVWSSIVQCCRKFDEAHAGSCVGSVDTPWCDDPEERPAVAVWPVVLATFPGAGPNGVLACEPEGPCLKSGIGAAL